MAADSDHPTDEDGDWQFDLDEVGPDAENPGPEPIEPGSPSAENVLFVLLGVALALGIVVRLL